MTVAIRLVVHRSVAYPLAGAPLRRIFSRRWRSARASFGGRPGDTRTARPAAPRRRTPSRQRITELAAQASWRPTSLSDHPFFNRLGGCRRRASMTFADPGSRMMGALRDSSTHYCIIYAGVNNALLDTNQLVSSLLSAHGPQGQLVDAWRRRDFVLFLAPGQIDVVANVLARPKITKKYRI